MTSKLTNGISEELLADIEMLTWSCEGTRERIRAMPDRRAKYRAHSASLTEEQLDTIMKEWLQNKESELFSMEAELARALEKVEAAKRLAERLANSLTVSSFGKPAIIVKPRRSWVKGPKGAVRCRKCKTAVSVGYSMSLVGGGSKTIAFCECNRDDARNCEVVQ